MKFNDEKSFKFSATKSNDGSLGVMFINNPQNIIEKIRKSDKLKIEVEVYNNGSQVLEFDINSLDISKL